MKTRCRSCRKLIDYGNTYCDTCYSKMIKDKKSGIKNKKAEESIKSGRWKKVRERIIQRDKCCVLCLRRDNYINLYKLQVHHIIKRVDNESLIFEPDNLVTLCRKCHEEVELLSPSKQRELLGDYNKEVHTHTLL